MEAKLNKTVHKCAEAKMEDFATFTLNFFETIYQSVLIDRFNDY